MYIYLFFGSYKSLGMIVGLSPFQFTIICLSMLINYSVRFLSSYCGCTRETSVWNLSEAESKFCMYRTTTMHHIWIVLSNNNGNRDGINNSLVSSHKHTHTQSQFKMSEYFNWIFKIKIKIKIKAMAIVAKALICWWRK